MYTNNIELFPIFNPVDETGTPQWTARAAKEISDRFSYTMGINSINVYLTSMSHIPTLKSVLRSIATNFQVYELCICVEETHINTVSNPDTLILYGYPQPQRRITRPLQKF